MSDEYGSDFITVTDDEGHEFELEVLDTVEFEGAEYTVFVPAELDTMDVNDPEYGLIILKNTEEDGEELFVSVDDEAELDRVYEHYMSLMDEEAEKELAGEHDQEEKTE